MNNVGQCLDEGGDVGDPWAGVDAARLARAAKEQAERTVPGIQDMRSYLASQVSDVSHREVLGPLLDGQGASGVVVRSGVVLASWGDPERTEMAFSATKSVLSLVAGLAFDDGLLRLDEPVWRSVDLPQFMRRTRAEDHLAAPAGPVQPVGGRAVVQAHLGRRPEHP